MSLRHAWHTGSDAQALDVCREALSEAGIALTDAIPGHACDAVKMHGMDIVEARHSQPGALKNLQAVAMTCGWADLLPAFACAHMQTADSWHGIALGVHQSNMIWVNPAWAGKLGVPPQESLPDFLRWLAQAQHDVATPLAVGAESWQIAAIFESVVLATGGEGLYRQAFVEARAAVWHEPAMLQALEHLMALRGYVDDATLAQGWAFQLSRVQRGEAVVQFMGDWARMANPVVVELPAPGTAQWFVAVVDYFVPLAQTSSAVAERAALTLTDAAFQSRFAMRKGCIPVVRSHAWAGRQLPPWGQVLPSVAFDQCCATHVRRAVLDTVAKHFVDRSSAAVCVRALAQVVYGMNLT